MAKQDNSGLFLIKQIHNALEKRANNDLRQLGLTFAQMIVLEVLHNSPEKQLALKELEKRLHVAQSTTARIVAKMAGKGLVESLGDASDRRIKNVRLTGLGEELFGSIQQKMVEDEAEVLSAFTEAERMIFLTLLQKLKKQLK